MNAVNQYDSPQGYHLGLTLNKTHVIQRLFKEGEEIIDYAKITTIFMNIVRHLVDGCPLQAMKNANKKGEDPEKSGCFSLCSFR